MGHKGFQEYGNIFSYFIDLVKTNGVFTRANKIMKYTRRYFFISRIIKYMSLIITFIETSAILVVISTVILVSIPVTLVSLGIVSLFEKRHHKKYDVDIEHMINHHDKIMFIYASRGFYSKKSSFLRGMSKDFADQGYMVFVVSNSLLNDRFSTARKIDDSVTLIKLNYFYHIKKKFLNDIDKSRLTFIS